MNDVLGSSGITVAEQISVTIQNKNMKRGQCGWQWQWQWKAKFPEAWVCLFIRKYYPYYPACLTAAVPSTATHRWLCWEKSQSEEGESRGRVLVEKRCDIQELVEVKFMFLKYNLPAFHIQAEGHLNIKNKMRGYSMCKFYKEVPRKNNEGAHRETDYLKRKKKRVKQWARETEIRDKQA